MLSPKNRLKINKTDSKKWPNKKQIYTPLFKMVVRVNQSGDKDPKIGFIVPGKIKGAVKRNRVRRYFTEAIRGRIGKLPSNSEAILIVSKEASEENYETISNWIDKAISKIYTSFN